MNLVAPQDNFTLFVRTVGNNTYPETFDLAPIDFEIKSGWQLVFYIMLMFVAFLEALTFIFSRLVLS